MVSLECGEGLFGSLPPLFTSPSVVQLTELAPSFIHQIYWGGL